MVVFGWFMYVFFFKQKTAYELRISDWSSDVCSSDLRVQWPVFHVGHHGAAPRGHVHAPIELSAHAAIAPRRCDGPNCGGRGAGGGAGVARQCLGAALGGAGRRRQACVSGPPCRRRTTGATATDDGGEGKDGELGIRNG